MVSKAKECLWCRIKLKDDNEIFFGCLYPSPSSTLENLVYINGMLKSVIDQRFSHILIVGDFNMQRLIGSCVKVQRTKNAYHLYFLTESKTVFYFNTLENPDALEKGKHPVY